MERIYFLLKNDGPEIDAIKSHLDECKVISNKWQEFVNKFAPGHGFRYGSSFIGIVFDNKSEVPKGWTQMKKYYKTYRPKATECKEAYKARKELPSITFNNFGRKLGYAGIFKGMSYLFLSWEESKEGYILSCPIDTDGTHYIPKGECEELTASRYISLTTEKEEVPN